MPEDLKSLLNRIQKDGVEKAEIEAEQLIAKAKEKAAAVVREAEASAHATREKAEQDAAAFMERAEKSLKQAARDVVLSVGEATSATFATLVNQTVSETLTPSTLKQMLVALVEAYSANKQGEARIEILLPPGQQKQVLDLFMAEFKEKMRSGIEIKSDGSVLSGFRVSLLDDQVEHDFSGQAIADALCQLIRPRIGEIVRSALTE